MSPAKARAHAAALGVAWDSYLEALRRVEAVEACVAIWPSSVADVAPTRCDLLAGHAGRDGTPHHHRIHGSSVVVTW